MTVDFALGKIDRIVERIVADYNLSPKKDAGGNVIPHPLTLIDNDDKLFALDTALKDCAIKTVPQTLLVPEGSPQTEFKRVSPDYYVRVPAEPKPGERLDIDDGLAYGVMFMAMTLLYHPANEYKQIANEIYRAYNAAYKERQIKLMLQGDDPMAAQPVYFRYSSDGENWHDAYVNGDIYISFKQGDGVWSEAIRFVGKDGVTTVGKFEDLTNTPDTLVAGKWLRVSDDGAAVIQVDPPSGGGASSFVDLQDTPSAIEPGKMVVGSQDGDTLVFQDVPSGGGSSVGAVHYNNEDVSGSLELDVGAYNSFYIYPTGDLTLTFKDGAAMAGTVYTLAIVPDGFNVTLPDGIYGASAVGPDDGIAIFRLLFDGYHWSVVTSVKHTDYQP
ncbi:hypothetical protein [Hydrogenimonas sp.]